MSSFRHGFAMRTAAILVFPLRFREDFPFDVANNPVGIQTTLVGYSTPLALTAGADRLFAEEEMQARLLVTIELALGPRKLLSYAKARVTR